MVGSAGTAGQAQSSSNSSIAGNEGTVSAAKTTSARQSSSKWKAVRPWKPPASDEVNLESGRQEQVESMTEEEDDDIEGAGPDETTDGLAAQSKRMQLEVLDVSTTSVSLAVIGPPDDLSSHRHSAEGSSTPAANIPNISIKLNSAAWPHVFHSDASFLEEERAESLRSPSPDHRLTPALSNILVWGLSPGVNYNIELGVHEEEQDDDDDLGELDDASDAGEGDDSVQASATVRTLDSTNEPDVPPPPYSSHDPSVADGNRDAESVLRHMLEKLRTTSKQAESALHSSISALKRANDKLTREDQRQRQRIHMLEDSTSRLHEVAAEENAESFSIQESINELEETEKTLMSRIERRKSHIEAMEKQHKEESDRDDSELMELRERLDKVTAREDEVLARKLKLERELLPTYNIQLATLEADIRRMIDDQRRNYLGSAGMAHHNYGGHGSGNRSASMRIPPRHPQHFYEDPVSNRSVSHGHSLNTNTLQEHPSAPQHGSAPNTGAKHSVTSFLPVGLRRRSASLNKSDEKSSKHVSAVVSNGPDREMEESVETNRVSTDGYEDKQAPSSRFAWTNNSWASKVVGGGNSSGSQASKARKSSG